MMFQKLVIISLLLVAPYLLSQDKDDAKKHSFVGAETCGMCHKTEKQGDQLGIWKQTKHAQAYNTLTTPMADSIAQAKGFKTKAVETKECLECHVSGLDVDKSLLGAKFKMEDGVQCETCHGPGSDYKAMAIMKDKEKAVANGLMMYDNIETLCVKCHNDKSPTFTSLDVKAMWEKIKHPIPKNK
jgi:hypothetical protein